MGPGRKYLAVFRGTLQDGRLIGLRQFGKTIACIDLLRTNLTSNTERCWCQKQERNLARTDEFSGIIGVGERKSIGHRVDFRSIPIQVAAWNSCTLFSFFFTALGKNFALERSFLRCFVGVFFKVQDIKLAWQRVNFGYPGCSVWQV